MNSIITTLYSKVSKLNKDIEVFLKYAAEPRDVDALKEVDGLLRHVTRRLVELGYGDTDDSKAGEV